VTRKFLAVFAAVLLLVGAFLGYIGYATNREMDRTVTEQFNNQQLILARQIAQDIETHFRSLQTLLSTSISTAPAEPAGEEHREIASRLYRLASTWNVLAVGWLSPAGESFAFFDDAVLRNEELRFLSEAGVATGSRGPAEGIVTSRDFIPAAGVFEGRRIMLMTAGGAAGTHFFIVDPLAVALRYARDVRSGETGYAWVINEDAVFLAHYEERFINRNSLTVREQRNPDISYERVNTIVTDRLLKGMEGTDWYISGWHRGVISQMKKLLAYSPVRYAGAEAEDRLWSVGLAAPTTEVYGILQPLLYRGWLITGVSLLLVVSALGGTILLSLRWAQMLKVEVDTTTADLRQSEAEVRVERDKVKESMDRLLQTQEDLLRAERFAAIGLAASHLAHEIKNPLLLMGGFAAQVRRKLPGDSPDLQKLDIIEKEAKRLEGMLMEVLNFTRPVKPQMEKADITLEIEDVVHLVENDLRLKGVVIEQHLDRSIPHVLHDPRQIRQVLLNLVKNAGEAIKGQGRITIRSWQQDGLLRISINDSGTGMTPEVIKSLFSPFFTTKPKGTGLGLAVCSRILEDHGGRITVESAPGKGSTFTISLPLDNLLDENAQV
jgi:two-component system, NtrC family, sensor histidine kinase HydH